MALADAGWRRDVYDCNCTRECARCKGDSAASGGWRFADCEAGGEPAERAPATEADVACIEEQEATGRVPTCGRREKVLSGACQMGEAARQQCALQWAVQQAVRAGRGVHRPGGGRSVERLRRVHENATAGGMRAQRQQAHRRVVAECGWEQRCGTAGSAAEVVGGLPLGLTAGERAEAKALMMDLSAPGVESASPKGKCAQARLTSQGCGVSSVGNSCAQAHREARRDRCKGDSTASGWRLADWQAGGEPAQSGARLQLTWQASGSRRRRGRQGADLREERAIRA